MLKHRANHPNTKIVATLGPKTSSYEEILELVKEGVDVCRLNFSHGSHADHLRSINHILYINQKYKVHIGILADLQGPKLRVGEIEDGGISLEKGDVITFTNEDCMGTIEKVYMSYSLFAKDVEKGEKVLIDDGKLVFRVLETDNLANVKLIVEHGGILFSRKGVNLPDTKITQPALTEKDLEDLEFILSQPVNWIALSFVRKAQDVKELKRKIADKGHLAKVIAKIEKPEAVKNIDKIIRASNGIMIARGDLGVEMPMEQLPAIQKSIIHKCIQASRPVIVATQMMESMISNPSPSRAEITDVANAVLDGTDAVMLSGETSVGDHPGLVVQEMIKIIQETEKHYHTNRRRPKPNSKSSTFLSDVVCFNAAKTAEELAAKAIIGMTISGYTAFKISSYRPNCRIIIFSEVHQILSTLNLVWGVHCYYYDRFTTTDETIKDVTEILKENKRIKKGDIIVNTGSMPITAKGRTNMLKVTLVE